MKNKIIKLISSILLCLSLVFVGIASTFAWLTGNREVEISDMQGSIIANYFHKGTGTKDDPFVITRPVHYYNLVNLYQRLDGFSNEPYYFQLGYDLAKDGNLVFFNYDDEGNRVTTSGSEYTDTLNLEYYNGVRSLLPIGTSEKPFVGTFEGNGLTIKNLHVKGSENYGSDKTYSSADIGIFGYVAGAVDSDGNPIYETDENGDLVKDEEGNNVPKMASISNVYYQNVTIDLTGADVSKLCGNKDVHDSDVVKDPKKETAYDNQDTIYVGIIAGHITLANEVNEVYINQCTIKGGAPATCNFGYFGCVEDTTGYSVSALGSLVASLRGKGDEAGFGGSLDMEKMYDRVDSMRTLARSNTFRYDANKTVTIDELTGDITYTYPTPSGTLESNSYRGYSIDGGGTYIFYNRTNADDYVYITGLTQSQTTQVATYTYVKNAEGTDYKYDDAILISKNGTYVSNTNATINSNTNQANATPFVWDGNYLFTRVDGEKYYLNANGTTGVQLTTSKSTQWTKNSNNELSMTTGGTTYYLNYNYNSWLLESVRVKYLLSDGNNDYLSANGTTVNNQTNQANATQWELSNVSGNTTIRVRTGANSYNYLGYNNGALAISTTSTTWNKDGNSYYVTIANEKFYIVYENGWKLALTNGYKLSDGNGNYLTTSTTTISRTTEANAVEWVLSSPTGATTISTIINGTRYYLRYNNGLTISTTNSNNTWNHTGDSFYYTSGGKDYYIAYQDNTWKTIMLPYQNITDGKGNYLAINNNAVNNATNATNAVQLYFGGTGSTGTLYTIVNGENRYLYNNNGVLAFGTTQTNWNKDGNSYYVTIANEKFYIVYENGWKLALTNGYKLNDDNSNYLTTSTTTISRTTEANAVEWVLSSPTGATTISTIINGTKYYLRYNNGLTISTTNSNNTWNHNGDSFYYTNGGKDYYIAYQDNAWKTVTLEYFLITDNSGNYMRVTAANTFANTTSEATATHFYFSNEATNPSGTVYAVVGGTTYYLYNNNGTLNTTTTANTATNWVNDGNTLTYTNGNIKYAIRYNGTWNLQAVNNGTVITDGNGNYLRVTGTNTTSYTNTTDINQATRFTFSNNTNKTGTISTVYGTTTVYLRNNNGSLELYTGTTAGNRTSWSNNGNNIYNDDYYLVYDSGWVLQSTTKYVLSTGNTYMAYTAGTNPSLTYTTNANATNIILWNENSGTLSTIINGTKYYLYAGTTNNSAASLSTSNSRNWTVNSNKLRFTSGATTRYLRFNNNTWQVSNQNNGSTIAFTTKNVSIPSNSTTEVINETVATTKVLQRTSAKPVVKTQLVNRTPSNLIESTFIPNVIESKVNRNVTLELSSVSLTYSLTYTDSKLQVVEKEITTERTGSYFPIRVNSDDENYTGNANAASQKNTGYIIGGRYDTSSSSARNYPSDIRISQYAISGNISNSYSTANKKLTTVYTVDGSGSRAMQESDKTDTYGVAAEQFEETLSGGSNVYGLHFMNAEISMDHIIRARKVTILGKTFENYQFPESCIDFHAVERGTINFFAGTYFSGNNAFFSLHRIYRDENNDITAIKEISKVYVNDELGFKKPYIYLYKDGTYTNADGTYSSSRSLPSGYSEVFNTSYITNPSGVSQNYLLYYFEIPCNAGEYALGSVSGKTGAYLCYLDIGTNGGAVLESTISGEGNAITDSFNVDVRDKDDTKERYAILQYAINIPEGADKDNFSVTVSFDGAARDPDDPELYASGLYTLNVVNNTGKDVEISIFLVDNDENNANAFPYAYRLIYSNSNNTNTVMETTSGYDVWKSVATFIIHSSGAAEESSYTS